MCGVDILQSLDCLDLNYDTFVDQKVSDKLTDQNILVTNFNPVLLGNPKSDLLEFYSQRVFVNLFQKSGPENIAHLMHAADDLLGNLIQL